LKSVEVAFQGILVSLVIVLALVNTMTDIDLASKLAIVSFDAEALEVFW